METELYTQAELEELQEQVLSGKDLSAEVMAKVVQTYRSRRTPPPAAPKPKATKSKAKKNPPDLMGLLNKSIPEKPDSLKDLSSLLKEANQDEK